MSARGKKWTTEQKARHKIAQKKRWQEHPLTEETSARLSASHLGLKDLPETRLRKSTAAKGKPKSEIHKANLGKVAARSWRGGQIAENFAAILCPAGFIREYQVFYGEQTRKTGFGFRRENFQLDFAHVEGKVNIELDGPGHKTMPEEDALRDSILCTLGWRIIRIRHA